MLKQLTAVARPATATPSWSWRLTTSGATYLYQDLQSQLKAGYFGDLLHGRLVYGKGLLSNGSHFVNLAEAWLGPLSSGAVLDQGPALVGFDQEASLRSRRPATTTRSCMCTAWVGWAAGR